MNYTCKKTYEIYTGYWYGDFDETINPPVPFVVYNIFNRGGLTNCYREFWL